MKRTLTEHEKNLIRNNYHKLTEPAMANILGVGRFAIQQFKREEGLTKYPHNRTKKEVQDENIFNVNELNWVA